MITEKEVPEKIIERLKKLMRLQQSAEQIGSEGEANAAAAGISRLLTQYNLSLMDIDPEDRKQSLQVLESGRISFRDTYGNLWKRDLLSILCEFNYCSVLLYSGETNMIIIGTEENTATVMYLYDFLRSTFRKLAPARYDEFAKGKRGAIRTERYKRKYITSYLKGCACGLRDKLWRESLSNEVQEKSLVVCHKQLIDDYLKGIYTVTRKPVKTKKKDVEQAFCNGYLDGKKTQLNKAIK